MPNGKMIKYGGLSKSRLEMILSRVKEIRVGLIGDICLDIYWKADMTKSELSRETPHYPLPVIHESMSPGAGGNAAANLAALKPAAVYLMGMLGKDWRAFLLKEELLRRNINIEGVIQSGNRVTSAYCKPVRKGISSLEYEDPRIDFDNYMELQQEEEYQLLEVLGHIAGKIDVLCVSDQMKYGCITRKIREKIIALGKNGLLVVVDSRDRIGLYTDVILKPNEVEGYRAAYNDSGSDNIALEDQIAAARKLSEKNNARVCMTLGAKGCVFCEQGMKPVYVPSFEVAPPLDTCGAGDCFLSAFSCALAAGATGPEAAVFANMAADVIIKKIGTTGTAEPEEIRKRYAEIQGNA